MLFFCRSVPNYLSLPDRGQSSSHINETISSMYEEVDPASLSREVKGDYEYTQNRAFVPTTVSESGHGN